MTDHSDHDITVSQVWTTDDNGKQSVDSVIHCDTCGVDL